MVIIAAILSGEIGNGMLLDVADCPRLWCSAQITIAVTFVIIVPVQEADAGATKTGATIEPATMRVKQPQSYIVTAAAISALLLTGRRVCSHVETS
jgi:hypothetical protein